MSWLQRQASHRIGEAIGFVAAVGLHVGGFVWLGLDTGQQGLIESEVASVSLNLVETDIVEEQVQGDSAEDSAASVAQAASKAAKGETQPQPAPLAPEQAQQPPEPEPVQQPAEAGPQPTPDATPPEPVETQTAEAPAPEAAAPEEAEAPPPPPPVAEKLKPKKREKKRLTAKPPASRASKGSQASNASTRGAQKGRAVGPRANSTGARTGSPGQARAYAGLVQARIASRRPGGRGIPGTVVVSFGISRSGGLSRARVARSSGNRSLDALALSAVRGAAPFPPPPAGLTAAQLSFSIPFRFR